jgi:hypothetical protein
MIPRRPDGYVGTHHETIGSDILSVMQALLMPDSVLPPDLLARVKEVKPDGWYPIQLMLDVMETLDAKVGKLALVQMGRRLFAASHAARVKQLAHSAGNILTSFDALYHHANRGEGIGGWKVKVFQPGKAVLEKTTPHHCMMEEGILSEALKTVGVPALVRQTQCFRQGAGFCVYELTSAVTDSRWMGNHQPVG